MHADFMEQNSQSHGAVHGGDIYSHAVKYDFSVSLNPLGMPEGVAKTIQQAAEEEVRSPAYPHYDNSSLKEAIGGFLNRGSGLQERHPAQGKDAKDRILVGNGASELLMAVCQALRPGKALIPVPSFYGYERACRAVGSDILFFPMKEEEAFLPGERLFSACTGDCDLMLLANPNNPTGRLMKRDFLRRILEQCRRKEITVLLDESFIGFCDGKESMYGAAEEYDNLLILGSFTKLFSIPGIRLGYLYGADRALIGRIGALLPEWNVSSIAEKTGMACVRETDWIPLSQNALQRERAFLRQELEKSAEANPFAELKVYDSDANYLMLCCREPLYEKLLGQGILIRDLAGVRGLGRGFYRIGIRMHEENEVLIDAINRLLLSGDFIE